MVGGDVPFHLKFDAPPSINDEMAVIIIFHANTDDHGLPSGIMVGCDYHIVGSTLN